jgi:hypothetical protein
MMPTISISFQAQINTEVAAIGQKAADQAQNRMLTDNYT